MPKQPSRPGIPVTHDDDPGSGRHRTCAVGRAAIARADAVAQRMDAHVAEDDGRFNMLIRDVEVVDKKVDVMSERVGDLRVDVAEMSSTLRGISSTITEQNEIQRVRVIAEVNADVETRKTEKIAAIEDDADRRKARRALWLKIALALVAAGGAMLGALIERIR